MMAEQQPGLDEILEACLDAIETHGWGVEDCLARYPAYRVELEPLLRAALRLRRARGVRPPAAFRQQALPRLQGRLAHAHRQLPAPRHARQQPAPGAFRRILRPALAAGVVVLALAAATTGTIYAAGESLPGDPLYPVEVAVEKAQLSLAPPGQSLDLRMKFAEKRLREAEKLARRGDHQHVQEAVAAYDLLIAEVTQLLGSGGSADPAQLQILESSFSAHQARLQALLSQVPEAAQGGIATAIEASKHGQETAQQKIKEHGGGKPEDTPGGGKPDDTPGGGKPEDTPGGGKPADTPGGGKPDGKPGKNNQKGGNAQGNKAGDDAACADGSVLAAESVEQARRLAEAYAVPYDDVRELFCQGLTPEQVEASLNAATPASPY